MNRLIETLKACGTLTLAWAPDTMMAAGALSVAYGASLIYLPAGYIVGGILATTGGVLMARGAK